MKKVAVLGATGSIGRSALDVIRRNRGYFEPVLLSAHSNKEALLTLGKEFPNAKLAFSDTLLRSITECADGGADIAINGIAGAAGLEPSLAVLDAGCDLALANKETIVMAGSIVFERAHKKNCAIIPVDSEHSAIFQLLMAHGRENIDAILLTASGGPFREFTAEQLAKVKPQDALAHPTWNMGAKITVDSASMANKGLEVIEAARLFNIDAAQIKVVVHPQSVIHSMIRFKDGTVYAQLSKPDMRLPIQNALFYPQKGEVSFGSLDFTDLTLDFESPDENKFPLLPLAYTAARLGSLYPVAYNAANEIAVDLFLRERIGFLDISRTVESVLQNDWTGELTLESIWEADSKARKLAELH
jgi:1-deoxy-D-xylulose-5-phosphate reductoisomerase